MNPRRFYFRMLGTIELLDPTGTHVEPLTSHPKTLALLAFVVLGCRGGPCSRDTLLAYFWPDLSMKRARHALRQTLYEIRQALGEGVLEVRGKHGVTLSKSRFGADVLDLLRALDERRMDDVVALFRGELLPGLHVKGAREFDAWLAGERESLNRSVSAALWRESRRLAGAGDLDTAVLRGRQALVHDPYNESGLRDVMSFLLEGGRSMEALRVYRDAQDRVRKVGMKLGRETEALAERCRSDHLREASSVQLPDGEPAAGVADGRVPVESSARGADSARPVADASAEPAAVEPVRKSRYSARTKSLVVAAVLVLATSFFLFLSFVIGPGRNGAAQADASSGGQEDVLPFLVASARDAPDEHATAMVVEALAMLLSTDEEVGLAVVSGPPPGTLPPARTLVLVSAHSRAAGDWGAEFQVLVRGRTGPVLSAQIDSVGLRPLLEFAIDTLGPAMGLGDRSARWDLLPGNDAALSSFARGRQLAAQGQHHAAVAAFERATQKDGNFALGWYFLATMPEGSFDAPSRRFERKTVNELSGRLPRAEATVLEAQRLYQAGQPHRAEALLRSLLARHPHNADATYQLAEVLVHYNPIRGRSLHEARQLLEQGMRLQPDRPESLYHLSQLYLLEGDTAAFDRASSRLLKASGAYRAAQVRLVRARVDGDVNAWFDNLASLASDREFTIFSTAHFLAVYARDVAAALDVLKILTDHDRDPAVRSRAHVFMAELQAAGGHSAAAVREFEAAMALDPEHGASRAAHLMALRVLPVSDTAVAALARRIIAAPSLPAREVPDWLDVEAALRPWLDPYARAAARLALGDPRQARMLLKRLDTPDASRGARLLAANLDALLDVPPSESSLPWWGVTPTEAILSPFFSLGATRLVRARQAVETGHTREAERWFASLLDQSIPDLALARAALEGQGLPLERSGKVGAGAAVGERISRLRELALSH